jgi:uncharacterized protein YcbK (DUF882 family)
VIQLSEHFELGEFDCHDGEECPAELLPNLQKLVIDVLQPVRYRWRGPLVIVSGYRTPEHNAKVGGARQSTHLTAEGADIRPLAPSNLKSFDLCVEEMVGKGRLPSLGGYGKYKGWLHLDIRQAPDGHLRRWQGKGVGSEAA